MRCIIFCKKRIAWIVPKILRYILRTSIIEFTIPSIIFGRIEDFPQMEERNG